MALSVKCPSCGRRNFGGRTRACRGCGRRVETSEVASAVSTAQGPAEASGDGALQRAITDGEMVLHYQTKVECSTGDVVGVEALVRWNHPSLGLLLPDEFLYEPGVMGPLSEWVLKDA